MPSTESIYIPLSLSLAVSESRCNYQIFSVAVIIIIIPAGLPTPLSMSSTTALPPPQPNYLSSPAVLQASPTHISNQVTVFDMMADPRQTITTIEAFVMADPSCVNSVSPQMGWTPLHDATRTADTRLIRFFLDHGAWIEARGHAGETPLMVACEVIASYS